MNKLNKNEKKVRMIIGGVVLLIVLSFVEINYKEYQKRENIRKACDDMKEARERLERWGMLSPNSLETEKSHKIRFTYEGVDCDQIK